MDILKQDTICAIATAQGGAIGVIRVSGPDAIAMADAVFRPKAQGRPLCERKAYTLAFGDIVDADGSIIDEVLVSIFRAPHSYTGEDSVEISCHGSRYILQQTMQRLIAAGCRTAGPGEYTQRAFLNGKMDLSQAEAVADLIASTSAASHRMAMNQMRGSFSKELSALRDRLLHLTSLMELELDFSDHEELEFADRTELSAVASQIESVISRLTQSFSLGNAIKHGVPVAIIGETNAGKSTLLNQLVGEERAIVSDIHGTTRDVIEDVVNIGGIDFRFIDTAGMRKKSKVDDVIERYSVLRATMAIDRADVCLIMIDAQEGVTEQDAKIAGIAHDRGKGMIIAVNKWDAIEKNDKTIYKFTEEIRNKLSYMPYAELLFISAQTGQRLPKLFETIDAVIENHSLRIATGVLNEIMSEAVAMQQPPSDKGKRLKLYYITQVSVKPPTFVIFVNDKELMHFSYTRYIENRIRESFGFRGTSIRFINRERKEKE